MSIQQFWAPPGGKLPDGTTDGEVLTWNNTTKNWGAAAAGGGGLTLVETVDFTTTPANIADFALLDNSRYVFRWRRVNTNGVSEVRMYLSADGGSSFASFSQQCINIANGVINAWSSQEVASFGHLSKGGASGYVHGDLELTVKGGQTHTKGNMLVHYSDIGISCAAYNGTANLVRFKNDGSTNTFIQGQLDVFREDF